MRHAWIVLGVFAALLAGCKGLGDISGGGGGTPTTPTPSASPTISPAPCATIYQGSNLVVVGMGPQFSAITATPYPSVAGYAVGNGTGSYPYTATLINKTAGGVANITTKNVLQFVNVDTNPYAYHSAAGFAGAAFPAPPYAFPSPEASPENSTIGHGAWSTGRVPPNTTGSNCYSRPFTLKKTGAFYFGDLDYYNSATSFRDVLVVSTPGP